MYNDNLNYVRLSEAQVEIEELKTSEAENVAALQGQLESLTTR